MEQTYIMVTILSEKLSIRAHAVAILDHFDKERFRLSSIYEKYFDSNILNRKYRSEITHLVQEIMRQRSFLDYVITSLFMGHYRSADPTLKNALRLGVYEILFRDHVPDFAAVNEAVNLIKRKRGKGPAGLTNALLRKVRTNISSIIEKPSSSLSLTKSSALLSHPKWLMKRWINYFGWEETEKLCLWNNQMPTITIRMNSYRTNQIELENSMSKENIFWKKNEILPEYYLIKETSKLMNSHQFFKGDFSFQDVSSGLIASLIKPKQGDTVLDVCAAPGGKICAIAEKLKNKGIFYAYDINPDRVRLLKNTVNRLGLNSIFCGEKDATIDNFPKASFVLVDAPCTGTGVMGKRADLRWRRKKSDIREMVKIQKNILSHCINFVKYTGELVYATCSLEPEEDWNIIDEFLEKNSNFSILNANKRVSKNFIDKRGALSTFPPEHGIDGVFGVILKRNS